MKKLLPLLLLLLCCALPGLADTLYAGPPGSGYDSLTGALAQARDGDIILLADG